MEFIFPASINRASSRVILYLAVIILLGTVGCGKKSAGNNVSDVTVQKADEPTDEEYKEMAGALEKAAKDGDIDAFNQLIDWDGIIARALKPSKAYKEFDEVFAASTKKNIRNDIAAKIIKLVKEGSQFRCLRIHTREGKKCILFRLMNSSKPSLDYFEFEPARQANGKVLVNDCYSYRSGETNTQRIRDHYLFLAPTASEASRRGKIEESVYDLAEHERHISEMAAFTDAGDWQSALRLYDLLPNAIQNTKYVLLTRLAAATQAGGQEFEDALNALHTALPNDRCWDFFHFDYYLAKHQYAETRAAIDRLDKQLGGDSYQDARRSLTYYMEKNYKQAREFAQKSIDAEDNVLLPYALLLQTALAEKNFDETARLLIAMEAKSLMKFPEDLTTVPVYAEFVESPQYQTWLKRTKSK